MNYRPNLGERRINTSLYFSSYSHFTIMIVSISVCACVCVCIDVCTEVIKWSFKKRIFMLLLIITTIYSISYSTAFSPCEKLAVIQRTFLEITKVSWNWSSSDYPKPVMDKLCLKVTCSRWNFLNITSHKKITFVLFCFLNILVLHLAWLQAMSHAAYFLK